MKRFLNQLKINFPWQIFSTGVILLLLSLFFKAYDMAVVSCVGVSGSFILFIYNCVLDRNQPRKK